MEAKRTWIITNKRVGIIIQRIVKALNTLHLKPIVSNNKKPKTPGSKIFTDFLNS